MNIFFLSLIPTEIAEMSCDQHVVKIQLEITQMLYMAWHFAQQQDYVAENAPLTKDGSRRGYRPAHPKHLMWLWDHHPSHFEERRSETAYYSDEGIPECMPEPYRRKGIVEAYQLYYMVEKMSFARYKNVVK